MPAMKLQKDNAQSGWALWFISETEDELQHASGEIIDSSVANYPKRLEWLAGRALVKELVEQCGMNYYGLEKNEFGKPYLKNHPHHISLSHSYPYVAAQIDLHTEVGIDLEQPKQKLLNIAPRILAATELTDAGQDIVKHCVYWCAKEALYKSYGKRGLSFAEHLNVKPFNLAQAGDLCGTITANGFKQELQLHYRIQPGYVLVCTKI
jgi:4'-phosphopantetheinyl transferase